MTIRKGEPWGTPIDRPEHLATAVDDAGLARLVAEGVEGSEGGEVMVQGGDVHRSLGAPGVRSAAQRLPMDLLEVDVDGRETIAVAHVVARASWWRGPLLAVMNVDQLGTWLVAPRAHPNDGRFDVIEVAGEMSWRDRVMARRRLPIGAHLPHPAISATTGTRREWHFDRPLRVWIDGVEAGSCRHLTVAIRADAYHLVI